MSTYPTLRANLRARLRQTGCPRCSHGAGSGLACACARACAHVECLAIPTPPLSPAERARVEEFETAPDAFPCPEPDSDWCLDQTACADCPVGCSPMGTNARGVAQCSEGCGDYPDGCELRRGTS